MAFVLCPKHGPHGAAAVCQHVLDSVLAGDRPDPMASVIVDYESTRIGPVWFCAACASRYGIPPTGLLLTGDEGLNRLYAWEWGPICPMCFRDAGGKAERPGL